MKCPSAIGRVTAIAVAVQAGLLCDASTAGAQSASVFLRSPQDSSEARLEAMRKRVAALLRSRHYHVMEGPKLVERLAERGVHRLRKPDAATVDRVQRAAREALERVAFGHAAEAISEGTAVLDAVQPTLSGIGRSDPLARTLGDLCLFVTRAWLQRDAPAQARDQARTCRRLVPDHAPSSDIHPPDVIALWRETADERSAMLRIELVSKRAAGCRVRLQGRALRKLDQAPVTFSVIPGRHSVQVDCGALRSFVHHAEVDAHDTSVLRFDVALEAGLALSEMRVRPTGDPAASYPLSRLPGWLHLDEIWIVRPISTQQVAIARWRRQENAVAERIRTLRIELLPAATPSSQLDQAVAALLEPPQPDASPASEPERPDPWVTVTGISSIVALVAAWSTFAYWSLLDAQLDGLTVGSDPFADRSRDRDRIGVVALGLSSAGAVGLAVSAHAFLPERSSPPLSSWILGGAGIAATIVGSLLWFQHGERLSARCPPDRDCYRYRSRVPLAPMLVTQGAALAFIPLSYAF